MSRTWDETVMMESKRMTVEELKKIADEMGYTVRKKQRCVRLLPCRCGCNRRERWYGIHKDDAYILRCANCGAEAKGSTEKEVRLDWNRRQSWKE